LKHQPVPILALCVEKATEGRPDGDFVSFPTGQAFFGCYRRFQQMLKPIVSVKMGGVNKQGLWRDS